LTVSTVVVQHYLYGPGQTGVPRRRCSVTLTGAGLWLSNETGEIIDQADVDSDDTGLVAITVTPQSEIAGPDSYYVFRISGTDVARAFIAPVSATPVKLVDCLVDETTLDPVDPDLPSLYLARAELGVANGVASLGADGKVPAAQLPPSSGAPDATTTVKGIVKLAGDLGGTAELPTVPGLAGKAATVHTHTAAQITDFTAAVNALIAAVVDAAPASLDTLNELAAALGDDPNFAATITALIGTKQPLDADLTTISGLSPSANDVLQFVSGAWAARSMAQLKTALALVKADVGLSNVDNTSDAGKPISTATQAALDLKDAELYQPSAHGIVEWTADPQACSTDFTHTSGNLLLVRFRNRRATQISQIGFCVTSAASGPGAYSGVALYEDGTGTVNRLGQSADAGAQWTSPGMKSIALGTPVAVTPGAYYRAAILWQGSGNGKIASPPAAINSTILNAGTRRSTVLSGQTAFPASVDVAAMTLNNANYFLSMS
jgi:hypothetical protein